MIDIDDWPAIRATLEGFFAGVCPPATAFAVTAFVEPDIRIEFEVDAATSSTEVGEVGAR
jgi:hypothetical protein